MRLFKYTFLCMSAFMLSVSCSKDAELGDEEGNSGTEPPGTDNPDTDKPGTDNALKASAEKLYADYYLASQDATSDVSWTGNLTSCDPGSVPQATKDKIFMRLEYFRRAVGLNNEIFENETKSAKSQKAALMMHANGTLDHEPPNDWECFSEEGKEGAGNSLLTSTRNAGAIDSYIRDQGTDNYPIGHRRWLLWPKLQEIGVGNTSSYNAVWVLGNAGTRPAEAPEFVAWPPKGYLPKQLAYARWSFSIPEADFAGTSVSMKAENGDNIPLEMEELTGIYGDNTMVWIPEISTNTLV